MQSLVIACNIKPQKDKKTGRGKSPPVFTFKIT